MCVYIGQYYAINLMFNSDSLAAFMLGIEGGAALSSSGHRLCLSLGSPLSHSFISEHLEEGLCLALH